MEKVKAIYELEDAKDGYTEYLSNDAIDMAIEALKSQLSKEGTTSDMISRQAAIDALDFEIVHMTAYCDGKNEGNPLAQYNKGLEDGKKAIEALPPAQPEPKEGHWIPHETPDGGEQYECSRCGVLWEFNDGTPEDNEAYYCPKCGKKLITK